MLLVAVQERIRRF